MLGRVALVFLAIFADSTRLASVTYHEYAPLLRA